MHPEVQTASVARSPDDFRRSVLQIVAELSPCSEEKLFIVAVNRGLRESRSLSLGELKGLLHDCVQQLEEKGLLRIVADEIVITEAGTRPLEAETPNGISPEPTPEKIVGYIREAIEHHQAVRAKEQTKSGQAEAAKQDGVEDLIDDTEPLSNGGDSAQATEEEILDLAAELGGVEIVEDDAEPLTELPDGDIAPPSNGDAASSASDEEIYDLAAELGALEVVEDDDEPVMELAEADETSKPGEPEPVDFERVVALYKAEQAPLSAPPQPKEHQLETASKPEPRTRATSTIEGHGGPAPAAEPRAKAEGSGQVLSGAAEMMRDIVMVLLLLAFAATSLLVWFNGKPNAVLLMVGLLLLGSAFWGWRGSRLRRQ